MKPVLITCMVVGLTSGVYGAYQLLTDNMANLPITAFIFAICLGVLEFNQPPK